jgi:uncharacterized protein YidB (DUF937 family)
MKKIVAFASAGIAIVAMAGSVFAATPATTATTTTTAAAQKAVFNHHKHEGQFNNPELLSLLKLDAGTLQQNIKSGKSLADIAAGQGVEEQKVIDLLVKQASERLDKAVQAGKLTQAQADEKKKNLQGQIKNRVENKGGFGFKKERRGREGHLEEVASVLGMSKEEVLTQLQSGKTLVQIAQDKGISKDELLNKLLEKQKERLSKMVEQKWEKKDKSTTAAESGSAADTSNNLQ